MTRESGLRFSSFVITISVFILLPLSKAEFAQVDLLARHNSRVRTGPNLDEKTFSPSRVNRKQFGPGVLEKPGDSQH
jgi:hypothetical protein